MLISHKSGSKLYAESSTKNTQVFEISKIHTHKAKNSSSALYNKSLLPLNTSL